MEYCRVNYISPDRMRINGYDTLNSQPIIINYD